MPVMHAQSTDTASRPKLTVTRLPADLVQRGAMQLSWVGGITAMMVACLWLAEIMLRPNLLRDQPWMLAVNSVVLILVSIALAVVSRLGLAPATTLLWLGMIYEVGGAFSVALYEHAYAWRDQVPMRGISAVAAWIVLCGLLLPQPPLRTLATGLAAAAMGPLAHYTLSAALKHPPAKSSELFIWCLPPFLIAVWITSVSRRMYRLTLDLRHAKEMGSYELKRMLGRGGMGEVWLARHRLLATPAAVKLIRPEVLISQSGRQASMIRKRFRREARATAQLRSQHSVRLYDFGVAEDGSFYYAMELLDGINLEQLVKRCGPQPPSRVIAILRQACDSLGEAHMHGLIHRDVKPTNLFICRMGLTVDIVKLLDFGLVKSTLTDMQSRMTMDGMTTGTPAFMAPEIAMGKEDVDGRADIYELGCVAYWLLTGQLVFDAPTPMAMALAHVQQPLVPPSERSETPIPAGLERIVVACLAKDRKDRPQTAIDLDRMLVTLDDTPLWTQDDAQRWWQVNLPCCTLPEEEEPEPGSDSQGSAVL
ncbi:MAG: serine/threonine protein kinase [Acidobacteriales bacterium]|nr:serine/threonine protein kinase [Terriglobales bacterium]